MDKNFGKTLQRGTASGGFKQTNTNKQRTEEYNQELHQSQNGAEPRPDCVLLAMLRNRINQNVAVERVLRGNFHANEFQ